MIIKNVLGWLCVSVFVSFFFDGPTQWHWCLHIFSAGLIVFLIFTQWVRKDTVVIRDDEGPASVCR